MYVIQRTEDGKFVAPPGRGYSYTGDLLEAIVFDSGYDANRFGVCDNERVVPLNTLLTHYDSTTHGRK